MALGTNPTANEYVREWLAGNLTPPVDASGSSPGHGTAVHTADATVSNASVTVLAANASRKGFVVQNIGPGNIRVRIDGSAPTTTNGIRLEPGGILSQDGNTVVTTAVKAIRETVDCTVAVVELS